MDARLRGHDSWELVVGTGVRDMHACQDGFDGALHGRELGHGVEVPADILGVTQIGVGRVGGASEEQEASGRTSQTQGQQRLGCAGQRKPILRATGLVFGETRRGRVFRSA